MGALFSDGLQLLIRSLSSIWHIFKGRGETGFCRGHMPPCVHPPFRSYATAGQLTARAHLSKAGTSSDLDYTDNDAHPVPWKPAGVIGVKFWGAPKGARIFSGGTSYSWSAHFGSRQPYLIFRGGWDTGFRRGARNPPFPHCMKPLLSHSRDSKGGSWDNGLAYYGPKRTRRCTDWAGRHRYGLSARRQRTSVGISPT